MARHMVLRTFNQFVDRVFDRVQDLVCHGPEVPRGEKIVLRVEVRDALAYFEASLSEVGEQGKVHAHRAEPVQLAMDGENDLFTTKVGGLEGLPRRALESFRGSYRGFLEKPQLVETVGDLVRLTRSDLLRRRNLGKVTVYEIERALHARGLWLGMKITERA